MNREIFCFEGVLFHLLWMQISKNNIIWHIHRASLFVARYPGSLRMIERCHASDLAGTFSRGDQFFGTYSCYRSNKDKDIDERLVTVCVNSSQSWATHDTLAACRDCSADEMGGGWCYWPERYDGHHPGMNLLPVSISLYLGESGC